MMQYRRSESAQDVVGASAVKVEVGIKELLEWAFAVEKAQLDFGGMVAAQGGVDTIWVLMQRGQLGCKVDGGRGVAAWDGDGQSADDAQIVASVLAALPLVLGGRGMAVRMAELARACAVPEFYPDPSPRVVPVDTRGGRHGVFAVAIDARDPVFIGWGRFDAKQSKACPVRIVPTVQQVGAARRFYLDWIGALMHLQSELARADLGRWVVTTKFPAMTPWRKVD